jgi:hypothetical protein
MYCHWEHPINRAISADTGIVGAPTLRATATDAYGTTTILVTRFHVTIDTHTQGTINLTIPSSTAWVRPLINWSVAAKM